MADPRDAKDQKLVGYRTNEEWQDLVAQASAMIAALDDIADEDIKAEVFGALAGIDALHREALHRLVRLFKEGVLEQVVTDPAINTLMGMYDLLPPEGTSDDKIVNFAPPASPIPKPPTSVNMLGGDPAHWTPAPLPDALNEGEAYYCKMEEASVLVMAVDGQDYAVNGICPAHVADMTGGKLDGYSWICPHGPGCSYDIRNGAKLGGGVGLICYATKRDSQGKILIGFGIPFDPIMPPF